MQIAGEVLEGSSADLVRLRRVLVQIPGEVGGFRRVQVQIHVELLEGLSGKEDFSEDSR